MPKGIDDLLIQIEAGGIPVVPRVSMLQMTVMDMLRKEKSPRMVVRKLTRAARKAVKVALDEHQELFKDDVEELTCVANAASAVWSWLYDAKRAVLRKNDIAVAVEASRPLGWLEALIKALQYKSLTRQAKA